MGTVFSLLGRNVTRYGMGCALAVLLGLMLMGLSAKRLKIPYHVFIRTACMGVPLILLMSRLYYVLANCTYYLTTLSNPGLAVRFWDGGYSMMGALAGICLACLLNPKEYRIRLLDSAAPGFLLAAGVERLFEAGTGLGLGRIIYNDFLQGLPFCRETDSTGAIVHAVYRYEALSCFLMLIAILICLEIMRNRLSGDVMLLTMVIYGCSQILLESLRDDGHMVVHFVRIQQVIAVLMVVIGMAVWTVRGCRKGVKPVRYLIPHLMVTAGIALTVWLEFQIDHSEDLILDYGLMFLGVECSCIGSIICHRLQMAKPDTKKPEGVKWSMKR